MTNDNSNDNIVKRDSGMPFDAILNLALRYGQLESKFFGKNTNDNKIYSEHINGNP